MSVMSGACWNRVGQAGKVVTPRARVHRRAAHSVHNTAPVPSVARVSSAARRRKFLDFSGFRVAAGQAVMRFVRLVRCGPVDADGGKQEKARHRLGRPCGLELAEHGLKRDGHTHGAQP